ncbi:MAG: hypothetical protein IPM81_18990 [Saprospirales bacterium]|nr:hypothetical protein [Saprospirales bacterium]
MVRLGLYRALCTPTADNSAGYEDNSPIHFADRLRGGNYLICHGIADDK